MLSFAKVAPYMDSKIQRSCRALQFRTFLALIQGAAYRLGTENLFETDCSGTICFPLFCMGFNIRLTAQGLFDRVFLRHVSIDDLHDYWDRIFAVFYEHSGAVSHVSPVIGRGTIFDAVNVEQPAQIKALEPVANYYLSHGYSLYFREIDWAAAQRVSESPDNGWDQEADEMLKELMR